MRSFKRLPLYLFLVIAALFLLYPLFFTFSTALMTPEESGLYPPKLFPSHLYLDNFREALETAPLVRFLLNSTVVSLIVTFGQTDYGEGH